VSKDWKLYKPMPYLGLGPISYTILTKNLFRIPPHKIMRISQIEVERQERDLFRHKQLRFKGSARVDISRLYFTRTIKRQMDDGQNVKRLRDVMGLQGCQRLMNDCHVPVLIPAVDWQHRVRLRNTDREIPDLEVDINHCVHAQSHESLIVAARERLGPNSQWWIADVYVVEEEGLLRSQ